MPTDVVMEMRIVTLLAAAIKYGSLHWHAPQDTILLAQHSTDGAGRDIMEIDLYDVKIVMNDGILTSSVLTEDSISFSEVRFSISEVCIVHFDTCQACDTNEGW